MTKLLHSGKFWLKTLLFGLLLPFLLWFGGYFGLQYVFSEARIRQAAETVFAPNGQTLSFDSSRIERSWFPYPAFTLHQVHLTRPQPSQETAFRADSLQVAFAWHSLWGEPAIHSLHTEGADLYVRQNAQGQWQLADLPDRDDAALPAYLALKQSTLHIQSLKQRFSLLQAEGFYDRNDGSFRFQAGLFAPQEAKFEASGQYRNGLLPQLTIQAASFLPGGHPFTFLWQGSAEYHADSGSLSSGAGSLNFQIRDSGFNLDAKTQGWQLSTAGAYLPETHFVFNTAYGELKHTGSGQISRIDYQSGALNIAGLRADTALSFGDSETALNLSGSLLRLPNGSFKAENLQLTTRRTAANRLPALIGQWQGQIEGQSSSQWQASLQGSFDNQEASFTLNARQEQADTLMEGHLQLAKLSLSPYLPSDDFSQSGLKPEWLSAWRQLMQHRQLQLTTDIGSLEGAGVQIQNVHARIQADADQVKTEEIRMNLYEGQASGRAVFYNRPQPEWASEIHFNDVQIKPLLQDTFRFNHLSGRGEAQFSLAAVGHSPQQWLESLGGRVDLTLEKGAWQGINLGTLLQRPKDAPEQSLVFYNADSSTPFGYFHIEAELKDGIGHTPFLNLSSDSLNLNGQGDFNIRAQTLDYAVLANAGNNLWLPLKIGGSISRPSFALDYERVTGGLQTPAQKQQALQEVFQQQWQWIQKLPEQTTAASAPPTTK